MSPTFDITSWYDQAFLVHECTHAHLDIQNIGKHSGHENEAVGYLAEAMWLEVSGHSSLGGSTAPTTTLRATAHMIAKKLLATKAYAVDPIDAAVLVAAVATHPHYAPKFTYLSNGFSRGPIDNFLRSR
ncbi:MAG: hypothetical protein ABI972_01300 [Acidobacteriota bacterium]